MSIEQSLASLQAAVEALTAVMSGAKVATPAGEKPAAAAKSAAATKPAKPAKVEPTHTREELAALLVDLKEKSGGTEVPKQIVKDAGKVEKSKDIPDELIDAVFEAVEAKIAELDADV